ncbi:MAG: DegV family protein [Spirochaetia bacterium]
MTADTITGFHLYHGFLSGYFNIAEHREYLNKINVFPVPDGDTGNNMVQTFRSIVQELTYSRSAGKILELIADSSLEHARGNSGIIISQYLNSLYKNVGHRDSYSIKDFGSAVKNSALEAYRAMENPVEGTILTVINEWAEVIHTESRKERGFDKILSKAFAAAKKALLNTPEQLKVLKENNVVDAGAWGFVRFLEGIEVMNKNGPVSSSVRKEIMVSPTETGDSEKGVVHSGPPDLDFRYCTEVLLENVTDSPGNIRSELKTIGNSLIVSKGIHRTRIHIHSNNPAEVVRKAGKFGRITQQKADDMLRQEQVINSRLGDVAVLTDSIADIPQEFLDTYQIHVLNLRLMWDNQEFLDRLTISPETFYREQAVRTSFPSSSIPARAKVDAIYQYLLDHYAGIIVLPVAKALSGTWQQMVLASEAYNKDVQRIVTVDTSLNSAAQGLLAIEIAKAAAEGMNLQELSALAENLKKRIKIFVSVQTFKYMVKGGRVSPLKGFIASAIHIKPIVSLDAAGKGIAFEKSFSQKGLLKKMAGIIEDIEKRKGIRKYCVVHALAEDKAKVFASIVENSTGKTPEYISSISPIVGMHSGKGAVAIGLIEKEE